ncbi:hypothetical protein ACE1BN_23150, partial [Aeromonas veronii]
MLVFLAVPPSHFSTHFFCLETISLFYDSLESFVLSELNQAWSSFADRAFPTLALRLAAFFKIVVAQSCFKQPLSAP